MESECRFTLPPVPGRRTQKYFSWGQYSDFMIDPQKNHQNASVDKRTFRYSRQSRATRVYIRAPHLISAQFA